MQQKLNNIQKAHKLTEQLNDDLAALNANEPHFSQGNGSKDIANSISTIDIVSNEQTAVNGEFHDNSAKIGGWQEPIPLKATATAPTFPIHCLPEVLRNFALAVAEHTQTPIDMAAVASLGTISACVQGKYRTQAKIGHTEPLNLYLIEIAKPGERKSAICSHFEEPLKAYERRHNEAFAVDIAHSTNVKQVLEKELDALKNEIAKGKKSYSDMETKQAEIIQHEEVKPLRLLCGDVTPEALTSLLADNNGKMALFSAEGGIFDTLRGLYSQFANIDIFLFGHSGDTMFVDRKGRPRETLEKPCLTVLLFIQPKVLTEVLGNDVFKGRGLTARFLYTYPVSTVGKRRYKTEPIPPAVEQSYHKLCDDLLSITQKELRLLTLSQEADVLSEQFFNFLEPRLGKDGDLEHMADWAGKHHGAVLRIAGLLHVVEGVSKNGKDFADIPFESTLSITGETMANAIEIGNYFLAHAQVCYGIAGSEIENDAAYILGRLKKQKPAQFTTGEMLRLCTKFKTVDELTAPLNLLIEHNYINEFKPEYKGTGRQPGIVYIVNPLFYTESEKI